MLKRNMVLCLISILSYTWSTAQVYKISYSTEVYKKTKDLGDVSDYTQSVFDEMDNVVMDLYYNKDKSIFKPQENIAIDFEPSKRIVRMARILTIGITHTYLYDLKKKEYYEINEYLHNEYVIKTEYNPINWKIMEETKIINGYLCNKAITIEKRTDRKGITEDLKIIAWFAKDIPYSFGPKNYFGLPGLILELHEGLNRISYLASQIELSSNKTIDFIFPKNAEWISMEDFKKITRN